MSTLDLIILCITVTVNIFGIIYFMYMGNKDSCGLWCDLDNRVRKLERRVYNQGVNYGD